MPERPLEELERLAKPPIAEVACGIGFDAVSDLDPVLVGAYWAQGPVRERFPRRAVHPAIEESLPGRPGIVVTDGPPPQRAWLISADSTFVVQLQSDRFFLNWRWMGGEYPCFKGREGGNLGVLERTLQEFASVSAYVQEVVGRPLTPRRVDVLKVDMLNEGTHWHDAADVAVMLPVMASLFMTGPFRQPEFTVILTEKVAGCTVRLSAQRLGREPTRHIRIETQVARALMDGESVRDGLIAAERLADDVFAGLIPRDQRDQRFKEGS